MTSGPRVNGWVTDEDELAEARAALRMLVGSRIERVRYVELNYGETQDPSWNLSGPVFDSIDFGVELDLADGALWSFTWRQYDIDNGLIAGAGPLTPAGVSLETFDTYVWDASEHWHERGPRVVGDVASAWDRRGVGPAQNWAGEPVGPARESHLCLRTLVLSADDAREAVITLGGRRADWSYEPFAEDNIAVFFSAAASRDAGVLLPGDADCAA